MFYNGILVYILTRNIETCTKKMDLFFAVVDVVLLTFCQFRGRLEISMFNQCPDITASLE